MRILVIGSGGREHAIIKKLKQSPKVTALFAAPGNGGIAQDATCFSIGVMEFEKIADCALENKIDLVVVAPDDPLCAGLVDYLEGRGIKAFGPNKVAAQIEGSKSFAKALMKKYHIPTAAYEVFTDFESALAYVRAQNTYPTVVKADGLALGKGVVIAQDEAEAEQALREMFLDQKFGASGSKVVIEECLSGPEGSLLCFCDGKTIVPMVCAKDHKRIGEHDTGLNTGGMGTIAPNPLYTPDIADACINNICLPTVAALNAEGITFRGVIFIGLMFTKDGPKVIEYNARFGDPETQVVLPLLQSDLAEIFMAVTEGRLAETEVKFAENQAAACVILASGGYPQKYQSGYEITGLDACEATVYHAGTKCVDGKLVTAGGRVLGVTAVGSDLADALKKAYAEADKVQFTDKYCRRDIGVIYQ